MRSGLQTTAFRAALPALSLLFYAGPSSAASITVETEIYEWTESVPEQELAAAPTMLPQQVDSGRKLLASYGPFHVVGHDRVELAGSIESSSVGQFRAMLSAWPGIMQIDMVDCPGTGDDAAIFAIARLVRRAGIATHVPDGGFVASGAVELFLSGAKRSAAPTAEFAVHSWRDSDGMEADDYAADDPVNMEYIRFYTEMGLPQDKANAFYALTNSVGHDDALYLGRSDIAAYIPLD
ncbi:hypothetical protein ACFOWX_10655 [Sphingorhabdus arenilitoris]|uniref:Alpha/beta hydrolase n=1 Tax=Sphingorhabdus arenilitoris TaxID=1490041 RepID=A0ABV8RHK7_9SPHN